MSGLRISPLQTTPATRLGSAPAAKLATRAGTAMSVDHYTKTEARSLGFLGTLKMLALDSIHESRSRVNALKKLQHPLGITESFTTQHNNVLKSVEGNAFFSVQPPSLLSGAVLSSVPSPL